METPEEIVTNPNTSEVSNNIQPTVKNPTVRRPAVRKPAVKTELTVILAHETAQKDNGKTNIILLKIF